MLESGWFRCWVIQTSECVRNLNVLRSRLFPFSLWLCRGGHAVFFTRLLQVSLFQRLRIRWVVLLVALLLPLVVQVQLQLVEVQVSLVSAEVVLVLLVPVVCVVLGQRLVLLVGVPEALVERALWPPGRW